MVGLKPFNIVRKESPLAAEEAWQIECFLLKIFEYGNYSFRRALSGTYDENLKCIFYLAYDCEQIIGVAGCLFAAQKPVSAILGPVAVRPDCRSRGTATGLCLKLLDDLKDYGVARVYLGVSQGHPARELYHRLGFTDYTGIVMQKFLCNDDQNGFREDEGIGFSNMNWSDYAEVSALMCESSDFITFDYHCGLFSSKYEPVQRFLPVFPELMYRLEKGGGCAKTIKCSKNATVVGLAQISPFQSNLQRHVALLEYFAETDYLSALESLVKDICFEYRKKQECQIICWIPEQDKLKKTIVEKLGAERVAILPNTIVLNKKMYNVEVFQL